MSAVRVVVSSSLGTVTTPSELRIRVGGPGPHGSGGEIVRSTALGNALIDVEPGSTIEDIGVIDGRTGAALPVVGQDQWEEGGQTVLSVMVELPPRHLDLELVDRVTGGACTGPVTLTLWMSSYLAKAVSEAVTIEDAHVPARHEIPFDAEVHRVTATDGSGQPLGLEPVDELATMVSAGVLRLLVGSAEPDVGVPDVAAPGVADLDFASILSGTAFSTGQSAGGHPDELPAVEVQPPPAMVSYSALRTLGRVDYLVTWLGEAVCWRTTDNFWVVPGPGAGEHLGVDALQGVRADAADVLALALGARSVVRGATA